VNIIEHYLDAGLVINTRITIHSRLLHILVALLLSITSCWSLICREAQM